MPFGTRDELIATVADWIGPDPALTAVVPDWITLAEDAFENGRELAGQDIPPLRALDQEKTVELVPGSGTETDRSAWPDDCLEIRIIQSPLNTSYGHRPYGALDQVGLQQLYAAPTTQVGYNDIPTRFAIVGREIKYSAIPNDAYRFPCVYYARIPALTDANPTNWLLQRAPSAYLYMCLAAGEQYTQNDVRFPLWVQSAFAAVSALNETDDSARYSGGFMVPTSDMGHY